VAWYVNLIIPGAGQILAYSQKRIGIEDGKPDFLDKNSRQTI
jgi:hypothetical protein